MNGFRLTLSRQPSATFASPVKAHGDRLNEIEAVLCNIYNDVQNVTMLASLVQC
jgi:hypothetical protein